MVNTAAKQQQQNQPLTTTTTTTSSNQQQQQQQPATGGVSQNVTDLRNLKKVRKPFQSFDSVSQDITVQPVTLHPIELVPEVSLVVQEMPMVLIPIGDGGGPPPLTLLSPLTTTTTLPTTSTSTTPMTFINLTEESSMELPPLVRTTVTLPTPMQTDTSDGVTEPEPEPEVVPVASSSRSKRYQCPACPYVTDSKTQFAYHKSFHRPRGDPYQCSECSYNVTKKHLLIQHQKTHMHSTVSPVSEAPAKQPLGELSLVMGNATKSSGLTPAEILDLTKNMGHEVSITPAINNSNSSNSTGKGQLVPKIVYYCKNCPARYLDESEIVIHQNKHHQQDKYKCDLCSFSTCDESGIANHRNVHGLNYRIVTAELRRHNVESERHPRPKIITIRVGDEKAWVVKRDYEAMQPPEPEEPILVEDPIVIEDSAAVEDPVVVVEDPVPIVEDSAPIEDPVIVEDPVTIEDPVMVEDPVPEVEPMQVEEPAPAPPTPPQPPPTPPPSPPKAKKTDPPRIRRSTRVKQPAPQPTKRTLIKKSSSKQLYSCDHCDHTDKDEAALKDHVKFHFRDILFPRRVDGVEARRGPFRQKITMVDDPEQSFELRFESEEEEEDHEEECPEEERIFIEI